MAPRLMFINLPVASLDAAVKFYTDIGFTPNPTFSDSNSACVVLSETISVMLHVPDRFATWVPAGRTAANAKTHTEVLLCFSAESKEEVDEWVAKAEKAGGKKDPNKMEGGDAMYGRSFEDLDGHVWEVGYMDLSKFAEQKTE
jgi:predicted lactoylglutathione lyase